jgi:hypothetical protein
MYACLHAWLSKGEGAAVNGDSTNTAFLHESFLLWDLYVKWILFWDFFSEALFVTSGGI